MHSVCQINNALMFLRKSTKKNWQRLVFSFQIQKLSFVKSFKLILLFVFLRFFLSISVKHTEIILKATSKLGSIKW